MLASDVDNPLLGLIGATKIYGPQKGLRRGAAGSSVDGRLQSTSPSSPTARSRPQKGAGAAGGLGFALLLLGGTRAPGVDVVAEAVGLAGAAGAAPTW